MKTISEGQRPKNLYNCKRCGNTIITEDKDEGVTPASLPCEMFGGCSEGRMWTFFYNVPPTLVASHEWYDDGGSSLNIRKIEKLREEPFGINQGNAVISNEMKSVHNVKIEATKGTSGRTKYHEKFDKSKRNGKK